VQRLGLITVDQKVDAPVRKKGTAGLLFEPATTRTTGDVRDALTVAELERI
jgi:hypothetical protein